MAAAGGQTWSGDLLHDAGNVVSDIGGLLSGPPGDPGVIRQTASAIEAIRDRYEKDRRAVNEAIDELTRTWTGDGASQFADTWYQGSGEPAPAQVLAEAEATLLGFARQLRDYADQLEHAQNEHWLQLAMIVGLTVVNAAQLGADPATDGAEVGAAATMAVGSSITLADVATMTIGGAFIGFGSDAVAQLGADALDWVDPQFDQTGDHVVSAFNGGELLLSTATGTFSGALFAGGLRALAGVRSLVSRAPVARAIASITPAAFPNLADQELATLRTLTSDPRLAGRVFQPSEHVGAEVVDDLGRSYDFLGTPQASNYWNPTQFFRSIRAHLLKSNDFTVVDLSGFSDDQVQTVRQYLGQLSAADQARIIQVGP